MIVLAEQISKSSTLILQRAKTIVETFYYLFRALCFGQECQFAMAPDFFFFFLLRPFEISVSWKNNLGLLHLCSLTFLIVVIVN